MDFIPTKARLDTRARAAEKEKHCFARNTEDMGLSIDASYKRSWWLSKKASMTKCIYLYHTSGLQRSQERSVGILESKHDSRQS